MPASNWLGLPILLAFTYLVHILVIIILTVSLVSFCYSAELLLGVYAVDKQVDRLVRRINNRANPP